VEDDQKPLVRVFIKILVVEETPFGRRNLRPPALEELLRCGFQLDLVNVRQVFDYLIEEVSR
jgi:hypothetical protein